MSEYFPKPKSLGANVNVQLDLSNYATKSDLKNAAGVDILDFPKKSDLANLKSDVDKLDIDKLKNAPANLSNLKSKVDKLDVDKLVPVPANLTKLSDIVKNDVVKKIYVMLRSKILHIRNLATNTTLNAKINEIKNKIPSITNLAATAALTTVENKIPNVSDLVKKENHDVKISEMEKNMLLLLIIIS